LVVPRPHWEFRVAARPNRSKTLDLSVNREGLMPLKECRGGSAESGQCVIHHGRHSSHMGGAVTSLRRRYPGALATLRASAATAQCPGSLLPMASTRCVPYSPPCGLAARSVPMACRRSASIGMTSIPIPGISLATRFTTLRTGLMRCAMSRLPGRPREGRLTRWLRRGRDGSASA